MGFPPQILSALASRAQLSSNACGGRGSLQTRGPEGRARGAKSPARAARAPRLGSGNDGVQTFATPRQRALPTHRLPAAGVTTGNLARSRIRPRMHKVDFNAGKLGGGGGTERTPRRRPRRPGAHYHLQVRPQSDHSRVPRLPQTDHAQVPDPIPRPHPGPSNAQSSRGFSKRPPGQAAGCRELGTRPHPSPSHEPWSVI